MIVPHAATGRCGTISQGPQAVSLPEYYRLLDTRYGRMLVNPNDIYIGGAFDLYGEFSEGEAAIFRQLIKPGFLVLDVGANIGSHTVVMAQALEGKGQVIAFEPQRLSFQLLCANVALNNLTNVECRNEAVGATPGSIDVPVLDPATRQNFGALDLRKGSKGEAVPRTTIDDLDLGRCDFIKMDIEGMEIDALKGAEKTIRRLHPVLYVENERAENSDDLIRLIASYGYRLYWHRTPMFNPDNFYRNAENVFGRIVSINMLCIPHQARIAVEGMAEVDVP